MFKSEIVKARQNPQNPQKFSPMKILDYTVLISEQCLLKSGP